MHFSLHDFAIGLVIVLVQMLAALPWLAAWNWPLVRSWQRQSGASLQKPLPILVALGAFLGTGVVLALLLAFFFQERDTLVKLGRVYGSVLHLQLAADLFVIVLAVLLLLWPKGAAVALAAFREGYRQPLFWVLLIFTLLAMIVAPFLPYFTFGEDHKMVEEIGYDTIMLCALLFGILAASISISDEIEGRTAVTLMSKPVSRRQFLLGKFVGILLVALVMTVVLGWCFDWLLLYKRWYDNVDPVTVLTPMAVALQNWAPASNLPEFVKGIELWNLDAMAGTPGLVLGFCQVMVLLAVAVSLATRLPMVVNLVVCLSLYFLGHLTPVLVQVARERASESGDSPVGQMLFFMAKLFDTVLPGLDFFSLGTAVVRDSPLPTGPFLLYVGSVVLYGLLYTVIVLVFGLILFEDRDLA